MATLLNRTEIIETLGELGNRISALTDETREDLALGAANENPWFTADNVEKSLTGAAKLLEKETLNEWAHPYPAAKNPKKIGLVLAGNIPLVGLHDLLAVWVSGHIATIKLSSKDSYLTRFILDNLTDISSSFSHHFELVSKLSGIDAVIATGSDNSARYFEYYFGKYPNVIRKNRSSVAILTGNETADELARLGDDIFTYFGLGCRNVAKIYVPENYKFDPFYEAIEGFSKVAQNHKFNNNYDYNKSVLLVNGVQHLDNGFLLLQNSKDMVSPISVLFYENYTDSSDLELKLESNKDKIQCIVGSDHVPFGQAQYPTLWDFADGVNTLQFLSEVSK